jgi:glyoxylase I family protein
MLKKIHHVAVICSNYEVSKKFYVETLGLRMVAENYRQDRQSYKLDLELPDGGRLELFSFPVAPARLSHPEARGLRHLAFAVDNIFKYKSHLEERGVVVEDVRVDEYTGKKFTFFADPDDLPLELYESDTAIE